MTITLFASAHKSLGLVLSILADSGTPDAVAADAAFAAARDILAEPTLQKLVPQDQMHSDLVNALDELAGLSPILKQDFIRACAACVIHDGVIAPGEGEVLQVIALKLDYPIINGDAGVKINIFYIFVEGPYIATQNWLFLK